MNMVRPVLARPHPRGGHNVKNSKKIIINDLNTELIMYRKPYPCRCPLRGPRGRVNRVGSDFV